MAKNFKVGDRVKLKDNQYQVVPQNAVVTVTEITPNPTDRGTCFNAVYKGKLVTGCHSDFWVKVVKKPKSKETNSKEVLPRLLQELDKRKAKGLAAYGEPLRTHNGRSALQDALEEALDLSMYLMQKVMEEEDAISKS